MNFYPVHHTGFLSCARRTASSPSWRHSSRARVAAARPIICPVAVWTTILPILQMIVAQLVGLMLLFGFHKLTELLRSLVESDPSGTSRAVTDRGDIGARRRHPGSGGALTMNGPTGGQHGSSASLNAFTA